MKKLITFIIISIIAPVLSFGQFAYVPEYISGDINLRDLTNPANSTLIGTSVNNLAASDFDLSGNLYAIRGSDNGLYQIDTTNASATLIGTVAPAGSHFWTGLACDPTDGTMYLCSTDGSTNDFYTINLSTATTTLIGSNSDGDGVVGIAFDDSGQMYAIYLVREFYQIDKTTGVATLVGSMTTACTALAHHGLDFCSENQSMYMVSYNAFTFDSELYSIDISTGVNTLIGSVLVWTGTLAVRYNSSISAGFSANPTELCEGGSVQYTDNSTGAITSWGWTFEGGTPGTSTSQNPNITYNTAGTYDVQLIVDDGTLSDTLLVEDMIEVEATPAQCNIPSGPVTSCQGQSVEYTTNSVAYANNYNWVVDPTAAGTITGTGTIGTFDASATFTGNYTVRVRAEGDCGDGAWSPDLACELFVGPQIFSLTGDGTYCDGEPGAELILDGSETSVDYELYLDDVATGNIVAGTGDSISFGYQTDEGIYSAKADNGACLENMSGQIWVHMEPVPGQAGTPTGPEEVCNNEQNDYTTSGASDADTLIWNLDPSNAGSISGSGTTITIEWDNIFSGIATLTVYGQNDCGDGLLSDPLEIDVFAAPDPEISGLQLVCNDEEADYQTTDNPGSSYQWDVTGGNIIAGSGTYQITVKWGDPGIGTLIVTETSAENCQTTTDYYEVTIDDCTGIEENGFNNNVKIYPNPANDHFSIEILNTTEEKYQLSIYNQMGQNILKEEFSTAININIKKIDISSLPAGLYFIKINNNKGVNFSKGIIKR